MKRHEQVLEPGALQQRVQRTNDDGFLNAAGKAQRREPRQFALIGFHQFESMSFDSAGGGGRHDLQVGGTLARVGWPAGEDHVGDSFGRLSVPERWSTWLDAVAQHTLC